MSDSNDPSPSSEREPADPSTTRGASAVLPMAPAAALLWTIAATFLQIWLFSLTALLREGAEDDSISTFGCQAVAYLLTLFFVLRMHAPTASIRDFLGFRRTHVGFFPIALVLGLAITVPANALYSAIEARYPNPELEDHLLETFKSAGTARVIAIGLIYVVVGPLLEEVFFRGALLRPLKKRVGPLGVIAITAAVFALAHVDFRLYLPIFLVGITLGALRLYSGSIGPSVLLHGTFNAIPFYSLVQASRGVADSDETIPTWVLVTAAALSLALLWLIRWFGGHSALAVAAQRKDDA